MNLSSSIKNLSNSKTARRKTRTDVTFYAPGIQTTYYLIDEDGNKIPPVNVIVGETYALKSDNSKILYLLMQESEVNSSQIRYLLHHDEMIPGYVRQNNPLTIIPGPHDNVLAELTPPDILYYFTLSPYPTIFTMYVGAFDLDINVVDKYYYDITVTTTRV